MMAAKPKPKQKPNKSRPAAKSRPVSKVKTTIKRRKPMAEKDKDHDKHEKEAAEKRDARDRQHENRIDNSKIPPKSPNAPGTVSPEDFMTEQDKAAAAKETKKEP